MRSTAVLSFVASLAATLPAAAQAAFPVSDPGDVLNVRDVGRFETLDYNGDGRIDLLGSTGFLGGEPMFTLSLGTQGGFAAPKTVSVPGVTGYGAIAVGEITGDAYDDAVATVSTSGKLILLRGRADGTLAVPAAADVIDIVDPLIGYGRPSAVGLGDVDGDGDLDVAAGFGTSADEGVPPNTDDTGTITILTNDGHGSLAKAGPTLAVNAPSRILLLALAGDSDPDLVVTQGNKPAGSAVKVFEGATGATFAAPASFSSGSGPAASIDWGDFNDDGRVDLAIGHGSVGYPATTPPADVLLGGASATLMPPVPVPGSGGTDVAVGDLDRDGHDDVYIIGAPLLYGFPSVPVFVHGRGDGSFGAAVRAEKPTFGQYEPEYGPVIDDLDGDGWPDVLARGIYGSGYSLRYGVGPQLEPSASEVDFGEQPLGTLSQSRMLTFVNGGPGAATDLEIVRDDAAADFPITADQCSHRTLALGEACSIDVAFGPAAVGERESLIGSVGNESDTVLLVDLFGTGTAPATALRPVLPTPAPAGPAPITVLPAQPPRIAALTRGKLTRKGLRFTQRFGRAGRAQWTLVTSTNRPVILGKATRTITSASQVAVTLRLSTAGRKYLARHRKAALRLRTKFTPETGPATVLTTKVPLRP
jgi:FG-GAP-like repeat